MARYSPELVAHVRDRYENTNDTLAKIAADTGVSERGINRMRDREGWVRRSARLHDLPPAARLLGEATALLAAREPANRTGPSPFEGALRAPPQGDGENSEYAERSNGPHTPSAIERIERLVEKELGAEEAVRAQLGPLPRNAADAERTARTLSTLTQTLHALQRLRGGTGPQTDDDDDMPRDIDEFRRDLARRIDAFVASRTQRSDGDGDPSPREMEGIR